MKIGSLREEIHRKTEENTVDSVNIVDNFWACGLCETENVEYMRFLQGIVGKSCRIM